MLKAMIVAVVLPAGLLHAQSDYVFASENVRNGRAEQAIPVLERLLAQSPSDLNARNLLGIALMNVGRNEEASLASLPSLASVQFEKALALDPGFHPALKNLAVMRWR
jgi:Flp pilus assembly protein TadD